jgi:hypothetical protein
MCTFVIINVYMNNISITCKNYYIYHIMSLFELKLSNAIQY